MIRALILSLFLITSAAADGPVARIVVEHKEADGKTYNDMGTGVLLRDRYVLTCRHLFDDGVDLIWLHFDIDGKVFKARATIAARDDLRDFMLLKLDRDVPTGYVQVGPVPAVGDTLKLCGYGTCPPWPGTWRCVSGDVLRDYKSTDGCHEFEVDLIARSGDSGGPMFDSQGRLSLMVWGCDKEHPKRVGPPKSFGHPPQEFLKKHMTKPKYPLFEASR